MTIALPWRNVLTDNELLKRIGRGDTASFETLFTRHYDRVYGLLFRLVGTRAEAEDLVQEVFLKLYQRPPTAADSNIGAWLYRVATNTGYNAIRSRQRQGERDALLVQREQDNRSPTPEQTAVAQETAAQVREVLAQLRPEQAQLLMLRHIGLSYAELAEACNLNPKSVGKLLSRAGESFRQTYQTIHHSNPL